MEPVLLGHTYNEISIPKWSRRFTAVQLSHIHFQWPSRCVTESALVGIMEKVGTLQPDFTFVTATSARGIELISFLRSIPKRSIVFECGEGAERRFQCLRQQKIFS
jgi:hypothetical protein